MSTELDICRHCWPNSERPKTLALHVCAPDVEALPACRAAALRAGTEQTTSNNLEHLMMAPLEAILGCKEAYPLSSGYYSHKDTSPARHHHSPDNVMDETIFTVQNTIF